MEFQLQKGIEVLERTPAVLENLLGGLSNEWIFNNEGPDTWSPFDILGHLIHGDKTDWMVRLHRTLATEGNKAFEPFDRFAQLEANKGKTMQELLAEFRSVRTENLAKLKELTITEEHYVSKGIHPVFGEVTLSQLLATWVAHDLNHIGQIVRVMAKQYSGAVGPWKEFLTLLNR